MRKKPFDPMKAQKRKTTIEKAKTLAIVTVLAFTSGIAVGVWGHNTIEAKYSKVPTVQVVQAQAVTPSPTPAPSK